MKNTEKGKKKMSTKREKEWADLKKKKKKKAQKTKRASADFSTKIGPIRLNRPYFGPIRKMGHFLPNKG